MRLAVCAYTKYEYEYEYGFEIWIHVVSGLWYLSIWLECCKYVQINDVMRKSVSITTLNSEYENGLNIPKYNTSQTNRFFSHICLDAGPHTPQWTMVLLLCYCCYCVKCAQRPNPPKELHEMNKLYKIFYTIWVYNYYLWEMRDMGDDDDVPSIA